MTTPRQPPFQLRPIGVMRSPHRLHHDAPRQPRTGHDTGAPGVIEVDADYHNLLQDLAGFSHLWVLFWCHLAKGYNDQVMPPRDRRKRGLFATRAPNRPNPIGMSALRLLRVVKRELHVGDHDLLDGTPILDIKPYLPYCDAIPEARAGWVGALPAEAGPDHRLWWTERGLEPPQVYRR